ncbi:tautomerase-like protein [Motilibacter rhizosphaerae]|uniref:Tautomerase-like protein n=1 Tax=Motilibacter rhizosphaerae TaxID=598652 RepID=A0A4Q7N745_9ACTN|nr:tautomerase family protein [Motilibacter rhizosphaerae]RZS77524.1 tautomerase-like protein [Motilibacter rhizosphaerae]
MPRATVEVRRSYAAEEEVAILDAVHAALVAAFRIPEQDKHLRLVVHEPHRFAVPPTLDQPDRATLVTIDCFAGRSLGAKRALYSEIVTRLDALGIPPGCVSILLRESPLEDWGISGGQAACDVELGFEVRV